jgi:hypothetical protein
MQDEEIKRRLLQKIADGEDSIEVFNALAMWRALPVLERIAKALERMDLSLGPRVGDENVEAATVHREWIASEVRKALEAEGGE